MSDRVTAQENSKPPANSFQEDGNENGKNDKSESENENQTPKLSLASDGVDHGHTKSPAKDNLTQSKDNGGNSFKVDEKARPELSLEQEKEIENMEIDPGGQQRKENVDTKKALPSVKQYRQYLPETEEDKYKYEGNLTICPICKQELSMPKHLPCLHTFCESCIADYFKLLKGKSNSFRIRCPTCKEYQPGKRVTVPASDIAHLLPTNHFLLNIIARKNMKNCVPCARGGVTSLSEHWCLFCRESLCNEHVAYHNDLTSRDVHRVQKIREVSKDVDLAYLPAYCEVHAYQKLKFYCEDHDVAACDTCRKANHRECPGLVTAESEAEELRNSEYVHELAGKLQHLEKTSVDMLDKISENLADLSSYHENDDRSISEMRQKISKHVKFLEKKLINELTLKQKEKEFEIQTEIGIFEKKRETLLFYKRLLELLLSDGMSIQMFVELPSIGQQSNILAEKMHHRAAIMQNSSIHVKFDDVMVRLDSMGSIVELHTRMKPDVPILAGSGTLRKLQSPQPMAMSEVPHRKPRQGFLVIRFQSSTITGATAIEGRLVLADYTSREIRAYFDNGNRDDSLSIPHLQGNPWDLVEAPTDRDGYTLIISFPKTQKILLLQWENGVVFEQFHTTKRECYGISNVGNYVIVACLKHLEFWKVENDLSMKRKSILPVTGQRVENLHPTNPNRILYSDSCDGGSFYCITNEGTTVFQYDHPELSFPRGIATDREGSIYVAGYKSNNIHKLTPEGELHQLIVPQVHLYRPRVLVENTGAIFVIYGKHKVLELSQI